MIVRELLEEIEHALHDEPILIIDERGQLADASRLRFDQGSYAIRIGDAPAIPTAQQCVDLTKLHAAESTSIFPEAPSTRTRSPFRSLPNTPRTAITAGMRISRAVTAPCESGPPLSVTTADAE
jgi:hypothetical protein